MDFRTDLRKHPDKNGDDDRFGGDDLPLDLDPDFKEMIDFCPLFCEAPAKQEFNRSATAAMNHADGFGSGGSGSDGENEYLSDSKRGCDEEDELYTHCVNLVVTERKATTSLLQRRFCIGYGRAAKIMHMMEERGVVSPPRGATRSRVVLVEAPEQLSPGEC